MSLEGGTNRFRNSLTYASGTVAGKVVQGRIVNINVVKWTVDVVTQFDRKSYFGVQVSSPYMHHSRGEGLFVMPEVGATCMLCIPGDSSPPFVLAFVMAHELVNDSAPDAPLGTNTHPVPSNNATDASFAGGRPRAKPGDIMLRTRDGNFITLHRGGVLSIGATELAQRIYIPLGNLVMDVSQNYAHHNAGGSITWGLQEGPGKEHLPSQYMETLRVFADDKYADIRVAKGRVFNPAPEPDGGEAMGGAGITGGDDNPIIYEVTVCPKGFIPESGDFADGSKFKEVVIRFVFDRTGNTFFRCEGNLVLNLAKKFTLRASDTIEISTSKNGLIKAEEGLDIDGGEYAHLKGKLVRLGAGTLPVARQGDVVQVPLSVAGVPVPCTITFASPPGPGANPATIMGLGAPLTGTVFSGNPMVRA